MAALPHFAISPEEYLALERAAEFKSEYYDGHAYVLAGATEKHNNIAAKLVAEIHARLKGRRCKVYTNDLKVRVPSLRKFFYPDVLVVCGAIQFHDEERDVILNPVLIIEVLSDSAAAYDRGRKFQAYQQIPSLLEYVLVAQDDFVVETFLRGEDGGWRYFKTEGLENEVALASLDCRIPLADIYDKVE
jgi:Uma2 family endonuclease